MAIKTQQSNRTRLAQWEYEVLANQFGPAPQDVANAGQPYAGSFTVGGSSAATTRVNSTAYEASHVLKASAGALVSLIGYNSGSAGFIQLFDSATVPADGAVPVQPFAVPGTGNFSLDVAVLGMPFSTGIVVVYSSTAPTKTIGSNSVWLTAVVK